MPSSNSGPVNADVDRVASECPEVTRVAGEHVPAWLGDGDDEGVHGRTSLRLRSK